MSNPKTLSPAWIKSRSKLPSFWRRLVKAVDLVQQFELTYWNFDLGATKRHFIEPVLVTSISGDRILFALDFNPETKSENLKVFFAHRMASIKQTELDFAWLKARQSAERKAILHAIRRGLLPECLLEEATEFFPWAKAAVKRAENRAQKRAEKTALNCP